MPYVITQNCCKDASCVPVCPVDCIRPVEAADAGTDMLYIDPDTCIDCGACMEECPVDAIHYDEDLPPEQAVFKEINAAYFREHPLEPATTTGRPRHAPVDAGSLRVAIVGAGPAACYAAADLIAIDNVEVNLFERLPTPFGLIRAGVAPDHQNTKSIVRIFERTFASPRMRCFLNVEIGTQLSHDELLAHHHAVIYAVGAREGRRLGIPGEDLPGVVPAADFVGWYNGQPDHRDASFDFSGRRAVIVGNGNVALDIARVLVADRAALGATDIADHALKALSDSAIDEVVILARRGIRDAAFSLGEFLALGHLDGVDVVIEGDDLADRPGDGLDAQLKLQAARAYAQREGLAGNKRVVFRFGAAPAEVLGTRRVEGLRVTAGEVIEASLLLTSIGYRAARVPGLPYDDVLGVVPNDDGRVVGTDRVYVTGWVKRGPRGVIGTNRSCAETTVAGLLADFDAGRLAGPVAAGDLEALLAHRGATPLTWQQWRAIDAEERRRGSEADRPRVKFVDVADMLSVAG